MGHGLVCGREYALGLTFKTWIFLKIVKLLYILCSGGSYYTTKPETGTFKLILSRGLKVQKGASRKDGTNNSNSFDGTFNANNELVDASSNKSLTKLRGNLASCVEGNGTTVTVKGKKTF